MSVLLETSLGDIVIDLYTDTCPHTTKNFLKLCKIKFYNNCLFHNIQKDFIIQTGDPTNTRKGGESIYGILYGEQAKYFNDEIVPTLKHTRKGTVAMASAGPNLNGSQFYITCDDGLHSLDEKHTIFGTVAEGLDVISKINEVFTDQDGKPLQVVRIKHTLILEDPFPDPPGLVIPDQSPIPPKEQWSHLLDEEEIDKLGKPDERTEEEIEEELRRKDAKSRAEVLEMVGDLPDADVKPPDNVLFVCKLNPVTTSEDLEIIFSRFGEIKSCEVIKDWKTGDSLQYAFIEFATPEQCEAAYFKMDNVLIDDRRIHVDFSQSVSKLVLGKDGKASRVLDRYSWYGKKRGGIPDEEKKSSKKDKESSLHIKSHERTQGSYQMVFDDNNDKSSEKKRKSGDSGGSKHSRSETRGEKPHEERSRDHKGERRDDRRDNGRDYRDNGRRDDKRRRSRSPRR